jgi:ComF family protein
MEAVLRVTLEALARLVAPPQCAACDADIRHGRAFCPPCAATLVRAANVDNDHIAAFVYGGAIAQTVRRFKFDDRPDLARALLAGVHAQLPLLRAAPVDLVVPVPLYPARLVERGYNQAALLAGPLAKWLHVSCAPRALARSVATERQTELARGARATNVDGAFTALEPGRLAGRTVLLVDDVETTGATLAACASALRMGGARAVRTVVIARAEVSDGP